MKMVSSQSNQHTIAALKVRQRIKAILILFIISLGASGLTAFPLETELAIGRQWLEKTAAHSTLTDWITMVHHGVSETYAEYPFIAYGTDWLAFAHIVIAIAFIGPLRDPVRNIWVIEFGIGASIAVIPMAFITGEARDIPVFWRLIDCSFGIVGGLLLWHCYTNIKLLENLLKIKPNEHNC